MDTGSDATLVFVTAVGPGSELAVVQEVMKKILTTVQEKYAHMTYDL